MARITGYDQEGGATVYLNMDHVVKVIKNPAGPGSIITLSNGESVEVNADPKIISDHASL